jgi:hypothetical protein
MSKAFMHPTKIINETESVSPRTAGLGILVALYPPFPAHGFRRSAFRVGYPLVAPNGARSIESRASHPGLRSLLEAKTVVIPDVQRLKAELARHLIVRVIACLRQLGRSVSRWNFNSNRCTEIRPAKQRGDRETEERLLGLMTR